MTTDDARRGEPLSDEKLHLCTSYATELVERHSPLARTAGAMLCDLLAEVARLRAENTALRAELAELAQAAELGAAGAFVAGMRAEGAGGYWLPIPCECSEGKPRCLRCSIEDRLRAEGCEDQGDGRWLTPGQAGEPRSCPHP